MKMEELAALFEAVKILPLRPTDVVVFRSPEFLPDNAKAWIRATLTEAMPGRKILVVDGGADIDIIRPET